MSEYKFDVVHPVIIPSDSAHLEGFLQIPQNASGIVLFAHGSGSSRFSARNQFVAQVLQEARLATLLFDLLTPEEEARDEVTGELRFDIHFLATRLVHATEWVKDILKNHPLPIGYFGASTGGGAAISAAAKLPETIKAVVSRGGRPDLAGEDLRKVKTPTLLIVGGSDDVVIELNQTAFQQLNGVKKMEIVPGATHLFEEPGTLEKVSQLAKMWFLQYLK